MVVTVALAIGAGLGFGAFMVCLANTPPSSGLWPLVFARIASLGVLLGVARAQRVSLRGSAPARLDWLGLAWLAGVLDMASSVLYLLAVRDGSLAVVGLLASLAPVSTVVLARRAAQGAYLPVAAVRGRAGPRQRRPPRDHLARWTRLSSQTGSSLS